MSTIHVRQIEAALRKKFESLIDLSDVSGKLPEKQQDNIFLSRALAALALVYLADVTPEVAAEAVTDGFGDNGLDAVLYHRSDRLLYLVQSKWRHEGKGTIDLGDFRKFEAGFRDLLNARFDKFNERLVERRDAIERGLLDADTRIVAVLAHTGQQAVSPELVAAMDALVEETNDTSEVVVARQMRQADVYNAIAHGVRGAPIDEDVVLYEWGHHREPYSAFYGQVAASDIAAWWEKHFPRILAPNIRMFLGETNVNDSLIKTLAAAPEHFWYFNNGVTALCASVRKKPLGGNNRETGIFECKDLRIVNGAQTAGAIARAAHELPESVAKARVPIRIISLEQCPPDFDREVTRSNNTQNRIERRDFVALDVEQERLRAELALEGVQYVYKSGDTVPRGAQGFDLVEATVARAVANSDMQYSVQAKREIGRLWEDIRSSPYRVLFNPRLEGPQLWVLVQALREVEKQLGREREVRDGREKMTAVHGNRFIAYLVMQAVNHELPTTGDVGSEVLSKIREETESNFIRVLVVLERRYPEAYLASLFKNRGRCQRVLDLLKTGEGELEQRELPLGPVGTTKARNST